MSARISHTRSQTTIAGSTHSHTVTNRAKATKEKAGTKRKKQGTKTPATAPTKQLEPKTKPTTTNQASNSQTKALPESTINDLDNEKDLPLREQSAEGAGGNVAATTMSGIPSQPNNHPDNTTKKKVAWSDESDVPPLQKRKSEPNIEDGQFTPGQNRFSVLSDHDKPLPKRARSNTPEESCKMDQVMDTDDQMEDLMSSSKQSMPNPISDAEDDMEQDVDDGDDQDTVEIATEPQTLMVKAPKDTFTFAPSCTQVDHNNPFTRHLPDDADENLDNELPPSDGHCLPVTMPAPSNAPLAEMAGYPAEDPIFTGTTIPNFVRMIAPVTLSLPMPQMSQGGYEIIIHDEHAGTYYLHFISAPYIFHNYNWKQIDNLYSA